jgi:hypothetical protein
VDCWGVNFIVGEITPLLQSGKEAFLGVIGGGDIKFRALFRSRFENQLRLVFPSHGPGFIILASLGLLLESKSMRKKDNQGI